MTKCLKRQPTQFLPIRGHIIYTTAHQFLYLYSTLRKHVIECQSAQMHRPLDWCLKRRTVMAMTL